MSPANAPRRCFICLFDEGEAPPTPITEHTPWISKDDWVDPCPCTLEAHQSCMLEWARDCEAENKPLQCSVCKTKIQLEDPWHPAKSLHRAGVSFLNSIKLWVLGASIGGSLVAGMFAHGLASLYVFAGFPATRTFLFRRYPPFKAEDWLLMRWGALVLASPMIVMGQIWPWALQRLELSAAVTYLCLESIRTGNVRAPSWPPSPPVALSAFFIARHVYRALYFDNIADWEDRMTRKILGLPEAPRRDRARNRRHRHGDGNRGGFLDILGGLADLLEDDQPLPQNRGAALPAAVEEEGGDRLADLQDALEAAEEELARVADEEAEELANVNVAAAGEMEQDAQHEGRQARRDNGINNQARNPPNNPARAPGAELQPSVSSFTRSLAGAILLPGICFGMGELLHLILPRTWTHPAWRRPTLLGMQWGRSLVGGCVFLVLRDALRLYAKAQAVADLPKRRVKNVNRKRGNKSAADPAQGAGR